MEGTFFLCLIFSLFLIQISKKCVKILQKKLKDDLTIADQHGKHQNRPQKIANDFWDIIRKHLQKILSSQSHYAYNRTTRQYFDNLALNRVRLYKLFCNHYKKVTKIKTAPMSLVTFRHFYKRAGYSF